MRGQKFVLFAIVLAGAPMWVLSDEAKNEFGVGLSWLSVEGDDSGFPLDGDLDGPRVFFQHETQGGYTIDAWYASEDGEFTLTTGDETDYESSTFEVAVGKWFCVSDCALRVRPYVGINKFSSENELVAFGSTINVNQDRLKLPVGVEVSRSFDQWELSADLELGYKFDENQDIPALGVDQDLKVNGPPDLLLRGVTISLVTFLSKRRLVSRMMTLTKKVAHARHQKKYHGRLFQLGDHFRKSKNWAL